jgi:hypothetical protein
MIMSVEVPKKDPVKNKDKDPKAIWDDCEVMTVEEIEDSVALSRDNRTRPEHSVMFKQNVGSEDVYLGMGDMTPATQSCSHMVIKVKLPVRHL